MLKEAEEKLAYGLDHFKGARQHNIDKRAENAKKLEEDQATIERLQAESEKFSQNLDEKRDELAKYLRSMDKSHVMRVNDILGKYSPAALCNGLESLVAMLRNTETASNFDVEIYFADYSKLMLKFQRINPADLSLALVRKHGAYLKHVLP